MIFFIKTFFFKQFLLKPSWKTHHVCSPRSECKTVYFEFGFRNFGTDWGARLCAPPRAKRTSKKSVLWRGPVLRKIQWSTSAVYWQWITRFMITAMRRTLCFWHCVLETFNCNKFTRKNKQKLQIKPKESNLWIITTRCRKKCFVDILVNFRSNLSHSQSKIIYISLHNVHITNYEFSPGA